ncbi:MAG: hypothetical protein WCJ61_08000 [Paludibacter sp.]
MGYVIKCSNEYLIYPTGSNFSSWMYTSKDITIEGPTYLGAYVNSTTYHLKLKKGWNEVVYTYKVTTLANPTVSLEVTNTTTENLKWRFLSTIEKQYYPRPTGYVIN